MAPLPPYPRKRLGQHFLIDPNLSRKIVRLADLQPTDCVCEIGPGGGGVDGPVVPDRQAGVGFGGGSSDGGILENGIG